MFHLQRFRLSRVGRPEDDKPQHQSLHQHSVLLLSAPGSSLAGGISYTEAWHRATQATEFDSSPTQSSHNKMKPSKTYKPLNRPVGPGSVPTKSQGYHVVPHIKRDRGIEERGNGITTVYSQIRDHLRSLDPSVCKRFHKVIAPDPMEPTTDVCLDNLPKEGCVAYSFGIDNKWFFDDFMIKMNCTVYSYDPSMKQRKFIRHKNPLNLFQPIGIDAKGGKHGGKSTLYTHAGGYDVMTLSQMMEKNGHSHVHVVRMDVEAAEWDILEEWTQHGMWDKIDQLLLEIHMFANSKEDGERYLSILKKIPFKLFKLQKNMHSPGQLFVSGLTRVYEMGYLDTDDATPPRLV